MPLKQQRQRRPASIPVVSMADIAFLLIIFFMLCTTFVRESGLRLKLPGAQSPDELITEKEVNVSIDKGRHIRVDDKIVLLEHLPTELYRKLEPRSQKTVMIRADESIDWGTVVKVMDVPKTIEEETGWEVGLNVAVEELPPPEEQTGSEEGKEGMEGEGSGRERMETGKVGN